MQTVLTNRVANLTELREPGKVLEQAGDSTVALMNRGKVTHYIVPASTVEKQVLTPASAGDVMAALKATEQVSKPVEKYLQDK